MPDDTDNISDRIIEVTMADLEDYNGACLGCGKIKYGEVEPDARNYRCDECGEKMVFGLQELMVMGNIRITDLE